ncbi:MAG: phosphoadenylyl-sulfate reductase [Thermoleophilaceae bacterium]|nr:phosphoadenylyl-sulfate reductase [Thermoleophilaceae bacterium]
MDDFEQLSSEQVLAHAVRLHHPRLVLACSFQKEETVLIDMLSAIEPRLRVFTIDTGELFPETYDLWRRVEERYELHVEVADASSIASSPWSAEHCCSALKVAALERALTEAEAWLTGLRREQSPTRAHVPKRTRDARGLWKYNPLADWAEDDVWRYVFEHELPYNRRHDQGYASIGCAPCTQPGTGREGRWAGQAKTECGLHV